MLRYIDNFLTEEELHHLYKISLIETEGDNVCHTVPLYQSHNHMHLKYADDEIMQQIYDKVGKEVSKIVKTYVVPESSWFNRTEKDSDYQFHTHDHTNNPTAIIYIDGCEGQGTFFIIGEAKLAAVVEDNSLILFNPTLLHSTPNWAGTSRMTMAITFDEKR
jgi:hypothetical protein